MYMYFKFAKFLNKMCLEHISYIKFEIGIPTMMCGYTLGVTYYFQVTLTLTSDLNSRKIVSRADLIYYLR